MSRQLSIHRPRTKSRRLRLRLEGLEGRALLSLGAVPTQPATTINVSAALGTVATKHLDQH
jgi:hypothetical protein